MTGSSVPVLWLAKETLVQCVGGCSIKRWFGLVKSVQVVYTAEFCSMRGREVLQERLGAVLGERLLAKLAA